MRVIAVQLDSVWEDRPANHAKVRTILQSAEVPPEALVILPEMFDTGFSMHVQSAGQSGTRESEDFLRQLANEFDVAVMAGVVGPSRDGKVSNEAVVVAPDGTELVRYQKMQPFTPSGEDQLCHAGESHRVFEWCGVKVAPFICYDLRFPEIFRPAAQDGAELITLIACWPEIRSEHWVRLLQARAIENQAYTVGVNRCGADPKFRYDGRSCAWDPHGKSLFEADAAEQVFSFEVDPGVVHEWRAAFPALDDMRR